MRKTILRRGIGIAMCLTMILSSFTACTPEEEAAPNPGRVSTLGEEREAVTILTGNQNYGLFAQLVKEKYPEVNLEFQTFIGGSVSDYMLRTLEEGKIPDIYTITFVPDGNLQKENLLDLSAYSMVNQYSTTALNGISVDGGVYLLPSRYGLSGIAYNKTLMEENGWEVPESFEELKELAPKIEAAGYGVAALESGLTGAIFGTYFALGNTNYFNTPAGVQWKKDFLTGDATAVGSLEDVTDYVQEWIDAGLLDTYYYDNQNEKSDDDFDSRKYVFQLYTTNFTGSSGDEFGFMPFLSKDGSNNMLVRLVSRYYGLNKNLAESGNEQKLEDALKVMEVMSTPEGQYAMSRGNLSEIPSTSINDLPEDSPYLDVLDIINSGKMVDMVYSGWEDRIVPLVEQYMTPWIKGEITGKEFLAGMDELNRELLEGNGDTVYPQATEDISLETAGMICAIAEGKATGADAVLIATPAFHGFDEAGTSLENRRGVHSGIFAGDITPTVVSIFAPGNGTLLTVTLSGKEITELYQNGFTVEGDPTPFPYYLATKGGAEPEDDKEYTLCICSAELNNEAILAKAKDTTLDPKTAVAEYLKELGTVTDTPPVWE